MLAPSLGRLLSWPCTVQDRQTFPNSVGVAGQVAASYLVMLLYVALALGYLPARARPWALLVTGRLGLGLGGVLCVVGAVSGALGLCSLLGMPASLIMLEVRMPQLAFTWRCCR